MILQDKKNNVYTRSISKFRGLCRLPVCDDGELTEVINLSFDYYPVMFPNNGHDLIEEGTENGTGGGIINANGVLAWVQDGTLYYDGTATGLTGLADGYKSMIEFWGKIFIFPDKKYYDIATETYADIGTSNDPNDPTMCPDMDYVCVHNNRVWGVKGNTIYASRLGWALGAANPDGKNGWTGFIDATGYPDDAGPFVQDFASEGEFSGIASWDDRIIALKPRCHHEVLGSYPSNYSTTTISKTGTTDHRSICEVDGRLYYACYGGMYSYAGGVEQNISRKILINNPDICCGTDGTHLYVCANNGDSSELFVYDAAKGIWSQQTGLNIINFAFLGGTVYAMTWDGSVYVIDGNETPSEWSFAFNDYNDSVYNQNDVKKINLKMKAAKDTKVKVELIADKYMRERSFSREYIVKPDELQTISFPLNRASEHDIRVSGDGYVWIYGFEIVVKDGGEKIV